MKYRRLYLRLTSKELDSACTRFHYEEQTDLMHEIYQTLIRCIHPVLYYEYDTMNSNKLTGIVSLGAGPDKLMNEYQKTNQFSKAYAVQCLSMELLSVAYRKLKEFIYRERRQFLKNMQFCDSSMTVELFSNFKQKYQKLPVSINEDGILFPSQTVIFSGTMGETSYCERHLCHRCDQKNCAFRLITGDK